MESFPPYRAKDADPQDCTSLVNHREDVNVAAVAWTRGSSAIIAMAEMPCSSRFGGVMCQVLGYELDATSGTTLRRMQPKEFAKNGNQAWRGSFTILEHRSTRQVGNIGTCHKDSGILVSMSDDFLESTERVPCPNCGKPVSIGTMNLCYIARRDCPSCGASILIEGDNLTVETPSTEP